ncbi:hypothetical protein M3Y96_00845200 [Aphelenchoides besseyi]|nr:hypothetical protein M3Y96_00845200 [Aphelenchoides besseyi]
MTRPREFLIPWIVLIQITKIVCQKEQASAPDHVEPFQNLFVPHNEHPNFPQDPFNLNGFRNLHNAQMLHPHELLVPPVVVNPNFIHPHPLFQIPQNPFAITPESPTQVVPNFQSNFATRTRENLPNQSSSSDTTVHLNRVPQASRPLVIENSKPLVQAIQQQASETNSSAVAFDAPDNTTNAFEDIEQKFQRIEISTTSTTQQTTTESSITASTSSAIANISNNLSQKNSSEHIDLIRHLNTSDIESFLHSANLSTNEAQTFLKLVEKVLEEELQNRLQRQKDKSETSGFSSTNPNIVTEYTSSSTTIDPHFYHLPVNTNNHEVKTVNTRLSYENPEADPLVSVDYATTKENLSPDSTINAKNKIRVAAFSQRSRNEFDNNGAKARTNVEITSLDDVRQREQAEFDRLLGQIVLDDRNADSNPQVTKDNDDQNEDDDLLPLVVSQQQAPSGPASHGTFVRPPNRHQQTNFDRLVQDYQYRLRGSNGLNDLIKALRNAHIGFFDRSKRRQKTRLVKNK